MTLNEAEGGGAERLKYVMPWTLLTSNFLYTLASPLASTPSNFRNPCNLFEIFPDELQWLNKKKVCRCHQHVGPCTIWPRSLRRMISLSQSLFVDHRWWTFCVSHDELFVCFRLLIPWYPDTLTPSSLILYKNRKCALSSTSTVCSFTTKVLYKQN